MYTNQKNKLIVTTHVKGIKHMQIHRQLYQQNADQKIFKKEESA